jgi:hypothetical protein
MDARGARSFNAHTAPKDGAPLTLPNPDGGPRSVGCFANLAREMMMSTQRESSRELFLCYGNVLCRSRTSRGFYDRHRFALGAVMRAVLIQLSKRGPSAAQSIAPWGWTRRCGLADTVAKNGAAGVGTVLGRRSIRAQTTLAAQRRAVRARAPISQGSYGCSVGCGRAPRRPRR